MHNIVAFANNDVATIAWSFGQQLPGCMGFSVHRIDEKTKLETPLPAMAVFPGETPKKGRTTEDDPVQKFYWKDPYARRGGTYRYKVVPMEGTPGALSPMSVPALISNPVTLAPDCDGIFAYFNRGLLSTQKIANALTGGDPKKTPAKGALKKRIVKAGDPLRLDLAGQMIAALTDFTHRASAGGAIYAALYELADVELIAALAALKGRLHIVLADAPQTAKDPKTGKVTTSDENDAARAQLASAGSDKFDRIMPAHHIAHNKFLVYTDASNKPQAVLFGSTNWTMTGLCAQTNNTVVIESPAVAKRYFDYWKKLQADTAAAKGVANDLQSPTLRTWDRTSDTFDLGITGRLTSWFSPNTKSKTKPKGGAPAPVDLQDVFARIKKAKQGIIFLAFNPGTNSIIEAIAAAQKANPTLFVRGCLTNADSAGNFAIALKGVTPKPKPATAPKGKKPPKKQDYRVISTKGVKDLFNSLWRNELVSAGFAVVHDKIVVIDPFAPNCTVVTGSHNLGPTASSANDENMMIIEGNSKLALAYMTHVLDVYDHFMWRWLLQEGKTTDTNLKTKWQEWQSKYFDAQGAIKSPQLKFWLNA
jgi:phosphatidylserine/phosphatidylglycerophosphate/cardiolipin synthase-like enzyme